MCWQAAPNSLITCQMTSVGAFMMIFAGNARHPDLPIAIQKILTAFWTGG
jgi:hypothetical protein